MAALILSGCQATKTEPPPMIAPDAEVSPTYPDAEIIVPDAGFARPDTGLAVVDAGPEIQACAPPLTILPELPFATPLALVNFIGTGGSGNHHFELTENNSGAVLNMQSGAYLSGSLIGTKDTIVLHDLDCIGTATATVEILPHIDLKPQEATIPPSGSILFGATQGSGVFTYRVMPRSDGTDTGTITPNGFYLAPNEEGVDVVRVRDEKTSDSVDAYVQIRNGAVIVPNPSTVYMPVGSHLELKIDGGSGYFNVTPSSANFHFQNGVLTASTAGDSTLSIEDRYTGQTTQVKAHALISQTLTATRSGSYINSGAVVRTGDINQDGFEDAAIAWAEINVGSNDSGAVYIYRGTANGLDPEPVRFIP